MRKPSDLDRDELERLAAFVQQTLYLDQVEMATATTGMIWNPDKEWVAADVCEAIAAQLDELGMTPERGL